MKKIKEFKKAINQIWGFFEGPEFTNKLISTVRIHSSIETENGWPVNLPDLIWQSSNGKKGQTPTWNDFRYSSVSDAQPAFSPSDAVYTTYFKIEPELKAVVIDMVSKAVFWFKVDNRTTSNELLWGLCGIFAFEDMEDSELNSRMISNGFGENYLSIEGFCRARISKKNAAVGENALSEYMWQGIYEDDWLSDPEDNSPEGIEDCMHEVIENPTMRGLIKEILIGLRRHSGLNKIKQTILWCWFLGDNNWSEDWNNHMEYNGEIVRIIDIVNDTVNTIRKYSKGIDVPEVIEEVFDEQLPFL